MHKLIMFFMECTHKNLGWVDKRILFSDICLKPQIPYEIPHKFLVYSLCQLKIGKQNTINGNK